MSQCRMYPMEILFVKEEQLSDITQSLYLATVRNGRPSYSNRALREQGIANTSLIHRVVLDSTLRNRVCLISGICYVQDEVQHTMTALASS